jgi:hypothetical protein
MAANRIVSKKELEDSGLSLRNFLNKERGLTRKAPEGTKFGENKPRNPDAKAGSEVQREGAKPAAPAPKEETPKLRARSLVDQGRGVQLYKDVDKEAVLGAGLGLASLYPGTIAARAAYAAARPAIGAAIKRLEDRPSPSFLREKDSPAASVADDIKEPSFNPDKMVDRRSTTFPGRSEPKFDSKKIVERDRSEPKFDPEKMTGRDRPEPGFKKGGKVSSVSKRGDGIAQRGKTKGRFI